jgi:hypothetical protein
MVRSSAQRQMYAYNSCRLEMTGLLIGKRSVRTSAGLRAIARGFLQSLT